MYYSNSRGVLEGYNATVEYVLSELSKKTDCIVCISIIVNYVIVYL